MGDLGAFVQVNVPLGATDTTQTTQTDAERAAKLVADIDALRRKLPVNDGPVPERFKQPEQQTMWGKVGTFVKESLFDYSNGLEGTKSATGTGAILYGLIAAGNKAEAWQVNEVIGAVHNTGGGGNQELARAASDLANRDADTARVTGQNNTVEFKDRNGARRLILEVDGRDNSVVVDNDSVSNIEGAQ